MIPHATVLPRSPAFRPQSGGAALPRGLQQPHAQRFADPSGPAPGPSCHLPRRHGPPLQASPRPVPSVASAASTEGSRHSVGSSPAPGYHDDPPAVSARRQPPGPVSERWVASTESDSGASTHPWREAECDPHRLQQRQKQLLFGKVTEGYAHYALAVPLCLRAPDNARHPTTPRAEQRCSKRHWDALVAQWRRALHSWDSGPLPEDAAFLDAAAAEDATDPAAARVRLAAHAAELRRHLHDLRGSVEAVYPSQGSGPVAGPAAIAVPLLRLHELDAAQRGNPLAGPRPTPPPSVGRLDPRRPVNPGPVAGVVPQALLHKGRMGPDDEVASAVTRSSMLDPALRPRPGSNDAWVSDDAASSAVRQDECSGPVVRLSEGGARLLLSCLHAPLDGPRQEFSFALHCPDGGTAAEVLQKLAIEFDVTCLALHVPRAHALPPVTAFSVRPPSQQAGVCPEHGADCAVYSLQHVANAAVLLGILKHGVASPQLVYTKPGALFATATRALDPSPPRDPTPVQADDKEFTWSPNGAADAFPVTPQGPRHLASTARFFSETPLSHLEDSVPRDARATLSERLDCLSPSPPDRAELRLTP